jgi:hypothetical protein
MTEIVVQTGERTETKSAFTWKLIRKARQPFSVTAEQLGLSEVDVAEAYDRLFGDDDWLTLRMEERLLLIEMSEVKDLIMDRLRDAPDDNFAAIANSATNNLKALGQRIDSRKRILDDDISKISQSNARLFGQAFDIALNHLREGIREVYPDLDDELVDSLVVEGLSIARKQLDEDTL